MKKRFRGGIISANLSHTQVNNITYGSNTLFIGQQLTPIQNAYNVYKKITYGNIPNYSFLINRYENFINTIYETGSQVYTVKADNAPDGTTVYWTVLHGTTEDADFANSYGSFTTTNGIGSFTLMAVGEDLDFTNETFQIQLRTDSISGPVQVTSNPITLIDVPNSMQLEYLLVAGGGSGGSQGGGGGAGGVLSGNEYIYLSNSAAYTITIGAGGVGSGSPYPPGVYNGLPGSNTILTSTSIFLNAANVTAIGGEGGRSRDIANITLGGGSGGGGGADTVPTYARAFGGWSIAGQGYPGGNGAGSLVTGGGGGGGGAGGAGSPAAGFYTGAGGVGIISTISGSPVYYAGGGGGGGIDGHPTGGGAGGLGGGGGGKYGANTSGGGSGTGTYSTTAAPGTWGPGAVNTGGGGGGGSGPAPVPVAPDGLWTSSSGGSGTAILRHPIEYRYPNVLFNGSISNVGNYRIYTFTTSGYISWTPTAMVNVGNVQMLLMAGGGGGGYNAGAGGGAGGLLLPNISITSSELFIITVGGGGTGATSEPVSGSNGSNTIVSSPRLTFTAVGGGTGNNGITTAGKNGGSGGGGGSPVETPPVRAAGTGYGYPGTFGDTQQGSPGGVGGGSGASRSGGGGGGANVTLGVGNNSVASNQAGAGGQGYEVTLHGGTPFRIGGGGGGGTHSNAAPAGGAGGVGGGGAGAAATPPNQPVAGSPGTVNLGGGGGAGSGYNGSGGAGGSGLVYMRHPVQLNSVVTGDPNVTYANSNTDIIYRFWQPGILQFI